LANIIESISGMPLDIFLDKNIFIPYGMKSTGLYKEHSSILGHAQGSYRRNNETMWMPDFNFKNFWGSGNGYSTSNDLFKYMINVKKYLNPKYSKQLIQHSGYYLGYRTLLKSIPELGITIVILSNNGNFNPEIILNSTLNYIIDEISSRDLKKSDTSLQANTQQKDFIEK
jgi:CubicO group peptidase (beta-lactamase class C family)